MRGVVLVLVLLELVCSYQQDEIWEGSTFYDNFNFFTGKDPTDGFVNFVNYSEASRRALVQSPPAPNPTYMGVDHTSIADKRGREAIRITSKKTWTVSPGTRSYLFVLDMFHVPTGCGTWPAWWFVGPNWPNSGEVDVVEGVNDNTINAYTLHTSRGCSLQPGDSGYGNRTNHPSCESSGSDNDGCGITGPNDSFGSPFNKVNGGVFAFEWNHQRISTWYFPRNNIPGDLSRGSTGANPGGWGTPVAFWELGSNCPSDHFRELSMVFDMTFCGDWAGAVFEAECPNKGKCEDWVANNPNYFSETYWLINFVKILSQ